MPALHHGPESAPSTPAWCRPGNRVALHTLNGMGRDGTVRFVRVERVGKRDIVLDDGTRINVNRMSRSTGTWSPTTYLRAADDPRVVRAAAEQARQATVRQVEALVRKWRDEDDDNARRRAISLLGGST